MAEIDHKSIAYPRGVQAKAGDYVQAGDRRGMVLSVLHRKTGSVAIISVPGRAGQREQLTLPRDAVQVIMTKREVRKNHFVSNGEG